MMQKNSALTAFAFLLFSTLPGMVAMEEPGTTGLSVVQLYSDQEPNKRGILVVRRVEQGSSAAEAGIEAGDLVISVAGTPVSGRNVDDIIRRTCGAQLVEASS
jgi:C-terminal processing protease CtpA/Prc